MTKKWLDFFYKVYLINLPERPEKLHLTRLECEKYGIEFEVVPAVKAENGNYGLFLTMQQIFSKPEVQDKNILVLEDDVKFLKDPAPIMERCIEQLEVRPWDLFHLGPNTHQAFTGVIGGCMLQLFNAFSTHAVAWSPRGMEKFLHLRWHGKEVDVMISHYIQVLGNCYCPLDMIATQRNGYSDIDKKEVVYNYIEERFIKYTQHLR